MNKIKSEAAVHKAAWIIGALILLLRPCSSQAQVPVAPEVNPRVTFLCVTGSPACTSGAPLANGRVWTLAVGTVTPQTTYSDSAGTIANTNPVVLDASGSAVIYLTSASYKLVVCSPGSGGAAGNCGTGTPQYTQDGITGWLGLVNLANTFTQTTTFSQAIVISPASNQIVTGTPGQQTTLNFPQPLTPIALQFPSTPDTMVGRATTDTLTNKTINGGAITNPVLTLNSIQIANGPATYINVANSVTGTIANRLTKLVGGLAQFMASTDVSGSIGITVLNAGGSGSTATIQQSGTANCFFDNATTAGDYVQISALTGGSCHDSGATLPTSGQIIGRVLVTSVLTATPLSLDLFSPEIVGGSIGAATGCTSIGPVTVTNNNALQNLLSCVIPANTLSAGSLLSVDVTGIQSAASGTIAVTFSVNLGGGTPCLTPNSAIIANNEPWNVVGKFAVLTAGAGGTANWSCEGFVGGTTPVAANGGVGTPTISINTTIPNTLLIAVQMSVANAGNTTVAQLLKAVIY